MSNASMTLQEYLHQNDMSLADFGERLGVSRMTVCRWVRGDFEPEPAMLPRIVAETGGLVNPAKLAPKQAAAARAFSTASARHRLAMERAENSRSHAGRR